MDIAELPATGPIGDLDRASKEAIAAVLRIEQHPVGTPLITETTDSTKFFVVLDGYVTVHRRGAHVTDLGPGDVVGEVGVLSLQARNATVLATTDVRLAVAMGWDIRDVVDHDDQFAARLRELASVRTGAD